MNPEVRAKMLRTPLAGNIQQHLDKLESSGVEYHTQVVLCPNLNDGAELDYTISEIMKRRPFAQSLAIVPVGITKYRRDKFPLTQFDKEGAAKVIAQVRKFQRQSFAETGETFVYLGDEFYFLAEQPIPPVEYYDDFPQIENGIGMTRNFIEEFFDEWALQRGKHQKKTPLKIDVISGTSFSTILKEFAELAMRRNPNRDIRILPVTNEFFGEKINVSGLLTGGDIIATLQKNNCNCDKILIPATALRSGTETFLDDVTVDDMRKIFPAKIQAISNGGEFLRALEVIK
jgi:putative radical SAM enzyme (TIGR03279 family)